MGVDENADFEVLYMRYRERVHALALRLLRNNEAALDAVQETFVRALRAREQFSGRSKPETWLYRIAFNYCVSQLRLVRPCVAVDEFERSDSESSRPEALSQTAENRRKINGALAHLSEPDRELLCLLAEGDLDYTETAEILGCAVEAVRMRVSRARTRLKEFLVAAEVCHK